MHDYQKLTNQPLVFVLAAFRFSPVLKMEDYIPAIQDKLRDRLPNFRTIQTQEVEVSPAGMTLNTTPNWEFIAKDYQTAATISQNRLLFVTSQYERFEGFQESCDFLLEQLTAIVNPNLLIRLGLRYADTITAIEGKGLAEEFVKERLFSNSDLHTVGSPIRQTCETLLKTKEGVIFVRSLHGINNFLTFSDADNLPIKIKTVSAEPSSRILLDFDHIWDAQEEGETVEFDKAAILKKLSAMHKLNRRAFWDITTDKAKEVWK